MRTYSNSVSIAIAVVSIAYDVILRGSKQTIAGLEVHTLTSHKISADVRRVAINSHFILNVVFLKINIFYRFMLMKLYLR